MRRVPIIDAGGQLVGIIAQADLAQISAHEVGHVVEQISASSRPMRSAQGD